MKCATAHLSKKLRHRGAFFLPIFANPSALPFLISHITLAGVPAAKVLAGDVLGNYCPEARLTLMAKSASFSYWA